MKITLNERSPQDMPFDIISARNNFSQISPQEIVQEMHVLVTRSFACLSRFCSH